MYLKILKNERVYDGIENRQNGNYFKNIYLYVHYIKGGYLPVCL